MQAKRDRAAVQEGLGDILGSVIAGDRVRGGRGSAPPEDAPAPPREETPPAQEPVTEPAADDLADIPTSKQADKQDSLQASQQASKRADKQATKPASQLASLPASLPACQLRGGSPSKELAALRAAEAGRLAASATANVTVRIPKDINDWLDEYVHRAWPERVRKQELVVEALKLLFARRGRAGEPVLETDLLPDEER